MKLLLILLSTILISCSVCPPGYKEGTIRRWERKKKFTASMDSCEKAEYYKRGLSMSRKF
jgi:hypothetical protein